MLTPSPPTKSLDFRGFDSSKLLILRGGNSHAPESLTQGLLVGKLLIGGLGVRFAFGMKHGLLLMEIRCTPTLPTNIIPTKIA